MPLLLVPVLDLSRWSDIQALELQGFFRAKAETWRRLGVGSKELWEVFYLSRSKLLRQTAVCFLGRLGSEEDLSELSAFLSDDVLKAPAAYAVGSLGGARSLEILREALRSDAAAKSDSSWLYFGLSRLGPKAFDLLLEETERRLEGNPAHPAADLPLAFLDDPGAAERLKWAALRQASPAARAAAIAAFGQSASREQDCAWLADLASREGEPSALRSEALRVLASLRPDASREEATKLFGRWEILPRELRLTLLEAAGASGWVRDSGSFDRIVEIVQGEGADAGLRERAIGALARPSRESLEAAIPWVKGLPPDDFHTAVLSVLEVLDRDPGSLDERWLQAVFERIESGTTDAGGRITQLSLAVQAAGSSAAARAFLEKELDRLSQERFEPSRIREAAFLGEEAAPLLVEGFRGTPELIPRFEALSSLLHHAENPEVRAFLRREGLAFLREGIVSHGRVNLGFFLQNYPSHDRGRSYATVISGIFGRFGDAGDAQHLESLTERLISANPDWPQALKAGVQGVVREAALRAVDLIEVRSWGGTE